MKIISPSFEILTPLDGQAILQHIELCGRVCYKSEDKITGSSAATFVANIIKRGHEAVLEQCAEELAELTQASLKMARKLRGENPTPVTHAQAAAHLHEELGDVRLCLKVLDVAMGGDNTTAVEAEKLQRWLGTD